MHEGLPPSSTYSSKSGVQGECEGKPGLTSSQIKRTRSLGAGLRGARSRTGIGKKTVDQIKAAASTVQASDILDVAKVPSFEGRAC